MTDSHPPAIAAWHRIVETKDPALLADLLADDSVLNSPAVHTPQRGKATVTAYLSAAVVVLGPTVTYHRQLFSEDTAVLEFTATVGDFTMQGIDMIRWDDQDRIVEFTVMVRPLKGLIALAEAMAPEVAARLTPAG